MTTEEIRQLALEAVQEKLQSRWIDCFLRIRVTTQNPGECDPLKAAASIREECATIEELARASDTVAVTIGGAKSDPNVVIDFEYLIHLPLPLNGIALRNAKEMLYCAFDTAQPRMKVQLSCIDQDGAVVRWDDATREQIGAFPIARFRIVRAMP